MTQAGETSKSSCQMQMCLEKGNTRSWTLLDANEVRVWCGEKGKYACGVGVGEESAKILYVFFSGQGNLVNFFVLYGFS